MVREKISLLILLLVVYAQAVEIYNDGQSTGSTWFKNWRKPVAKYPASNNQIIVSSTTSVLPKNQEPSSTLAPVRLEIKKTNTYIVAPDMLEGRSVSSAATAKEPVVEIKPRRRTFNFGSQEASQIATELPKASPTVISWIPENIAKSTPSPTQTVSRAIIKAEKPTHDMKPTVTIHGFDFGSIQPEPKTSKASPNVISWVPEIVKSEQRTIQIASSEKPTSETQPLNHLVEYGPTIPYNSETDIKSSTNLFSVPAETSDESKPSATSPIPPTIAKLEEPSIQIKPKYRTFTFGSPLTSNTETKLPSSTGTSTPENIIELKPRPTQLVAISEEPTQTEKYILTPEISQTVIGLKKGFNATELEIPTQPAPMEKSPGFIVYRYEDSTPMESTTPMPQNGLENILVTSSRQQEYKCDVENGYNEVVSSCDKFVECKNNVLKLFKCSNGLHFNRNTVWPSDPCDDPSRAKCSINEVEMEPKPERKLKPAKFSATLISNRIDYVCPTKNGYYRLENDCNKFIKCEEQIPSSYECANGLKFNSYATWGQDPCSAEVQCKTVIVRPEPEVRFSATFVRKLPVYSCPNTEGYYISENDCDQFIKCERSIASLYKCAPGLQFNRYASWIHDPCEKESVIGCKAVAVAAPPPELKISAELILARVDGYSCPSVNGYYRFENDCEKFIKCENYIASSYKCKPGLQFNSYALWGADPCASSELVRCKTVIIHPTLIPKLSAEPISGAYNFSCTTSNGYYGTETDCDQFYLCENSIASLYKCSSGLQFNRYAIWSQDPCADEKVIRCTTLVIQHRPDPKFSADLITRQIADYQCASSEGYFKLDKECDKFIKCEKSIASSYKCWSGLQFNNVAAWGEDPCANEEIIGCKVVLLQPKAEPAPKISASLVKILFDFTCPRNNGYFDSKNECEEFIKCENAVASLYKCLPGLQFNRQSSWGEDPCASETIVRCKKTVLVPPPKFSANVVSRVVFDFSCPTNDGYFDSKNECEQFIKCENAVASLYKCLPGLQFNRRSTWGEDPCASEAIVRCKPVVLEPKPLPAPKFSATLISRVLFEFTCPANNGYFESKNECEKFIKCENAVASLYKCLPGLQFNYDSSFGEDPCASESIVRCKPVIIEPKPLPAPKFSASLISRILFDFTCPANNGYFESKNECEKFIKCENAVASLYKCLPGLQFNHDSNFGEDPCASESIVRCKPVIIEPKPLPAPKFSATLISRVLFDFTCPANNGYFESKHECEQFIKCENAVAFLYRCLPGLQFNQISRWGEDPCASEEVVRCKPVLVPLPRPQFSADLISRYEWNFRCTTSEGYFKLENDCDKFMKCENSRASSYKCWTGLQFNLQAPWGQDPCAKESEVGCQAVTIPPPTTPKPRFSAILISSHLMDFRCLESNGYSGIDNNCERFVKCEMLVPSLYTCPKGLQFNRRARYGEDPCASASLVQCEVRTTTTTTTTTTPPPPVLSYTLIMQHIYGYTCFAANGYYSVKDKCEQFIECKNYIPSLYKCNSGLHFNRYVMRGGDPCALPSIARCEQVPKRPPGPIEHQDSFQCTERDGMFPLDNFECSKYMMCKMGRATIMPCPPGLVFNAELQTCDWPVNVPSCNPELFHGFTCPVAESDEYNSPSDKIIKFKYEQSCTQYIACQHGHPRLLSCDKGLAFSEEHQTCIHDENVPACSR